jgi:3-oxoacyl-[acyl-carrier protein] reductase
MKTGNLPMDLGNKVALVTGSGRGIGASIGMELGRVGAQVIVSSRTVDQIEKVAGKISANGGKALAIPVDVSDEKDVISLFQKIEDRFGKLDILVNNAGIGSFGKISEFPVEQFDDIMATNLRGTFLCCRQAMQMMIPRESGYIINISSVVGIKGYPDQGAYTASKHGIMGLTKTLAVEAQTHGIRVSAILPGGVDTELIRKARKDIESSTLIHPEDIAQTVMFLLSLPNRAAIDEIYIRRTSSKPF